MGVRTHTTMRKRRPSLQELFFLLIRYSVTRAAIALKPLYVLYAIYQYFKFHCVCLYFPFTKLRKALMHSTT